VSAPPEECKHEMPIDSCAWCKPRTPSGKPAAAAEGPPDGTVIYAKFDSRCPSCREPIETGDAIVRKEGEWVCAINCQDT
jgi:hypothetical protein